MTSLDTAAVDALLARARRDVDEGLLPSCQIALGLDGKVVFHEAIGAATVDTRYMIFSATKPFVAAVIWQLLGEGLLRSGTLVADVLPTFGTHGKDIITLDQVLQHTSGFPHAPLGPRHWATHEGRAEAFAEWRLNWDVGSQFEYHATSAHWVLGEMIHVVTGVDHTEAVRTRVAEPLGLDGFTLGVGLDDQDGIADLVMCGDPVSPDELEAMLGIRELDLGEVTDDALLALNAPSIRAVGLPGAGAVATAADIAMFYQGLLDDRAGLWDPEVLTDVTSVVRNTFPVPLLGHPANRSRGLVIAGDDGQSSLRGMGRTVSPATFGHNGAGGQLAWADPSTGLSFCYLTDGRDRNFLREHRRTTALASLAGVCAR